jgi:preprotein translocase subunit SecD
MTTVGILTFLFINVPVSAALVTWMIKDYNHN